MSAISPESRAIYRDRVKEEARHLLNGAVKEPVVIKAEEVIPEEVQWLWPGRLARGKISVLEGDPGLGKSILTCEIAARMSRGQILPGGRELPPLGTLFLAAEDGVADTISPRLIEAGADLTYIRILDGINRLNGDESVTIPLDLDVIESVIRQERSSLLVVDPLSIFLGDDVNENRNQEVKRALAPLKRMAERTWVAPLLLRHLTKQVGGKAIYRGAGSIGLGGIARVVMAVGKDPEDPTRRVMAGVKENLTEEQPSLSYRIIGSPANPKIPIVDWMGTSQWKADDLHSENTSEETGKLADAKAWLADYLRGGVMIRAKQVYKDAHDDGHAERTLDRAKAILGVRSIKNPADGAWAWNLEERQRSP